MDATQYQQQAARTLNTSTRSVSFDELKLLNCTLGLVGETGELTELVKKYVFHSHELDLVKLECEVGDIAWYLAAVCTVLGFDLSCVMQANIDKLMLRYPNGFSSQDSVRRIDVKP